MRAMILAAGLGTRLRPFTLLKPKPLFPVLGEPLLLRIVNQLRAAGFTSIIINAYHLADQLLAFFKGHQDIIIQQEPLELGTGGGLRMALPHFKDEAILVTNGDIYHDIDYGEVYARHQASGAPLTMVMHDYPRFNKVLVDGGLVRGFTGFLPASDPGMESKLQAFTGIHVLDPYLLKRIPTDRFYSIIDCYQRHADAGGVIQALTVTNHHWRDIGTLDDYLSLHRTLLLDAQTPFRCADSAVIGRDVTLDDWGFVDSGATIGDGATLRRVVVWPQAVIPAGATLSDTLVTSLGGGL